MEKIEDQFSDDISVGKRDNGKIRKIIVDREACIGARSCAIVAENLFAMDDENLAYVVDGDLNNVDEETIKLAAQACPVLAIHLFGEDGKKLFPEE